MLLRRLQQVLFSRSSRSEGFIAPSRSLLSSQTNGSNAVDYQSEMDRINDMFVEARDEIQYAQEDAGTTYFNDSYDGARDLVQTVLHEFDDLLGRLGEEERGRVRRAMGLKMEQLKAELGQLDNLHD